MIKYAYTIDENGFEVKVPQSEKLSEHDYEPMVEADYQRRVEIARAKGIDLSTIKRRTPEQIFNSINRTDSRKHFAFYRTKVKDKDGNIYVIKMLQPGTNTEVDSADVIFDMDHLGNSSADYSSEEEINSWIETESIKQDLIGGGLEPERVDLFVRCNVTKDKRKKEIAVELNTDAQSLTMKLQRIKKQSRIILSASLVFPPSAATENQEVEK